MSNQFFTNQRQFVQQGQLPQFCSQCGTQLVPNAKFCHMCAVPVAGTSLQVKLPTVESYNCVLFHAEGRGIDAKRVTCRVEAEQVILQSAAGTVVRLPLASIRSVSKKSEFALISTNHFVYLTLSTGYYYTLWAQNKDQMIELHGKISAVLQI